jgi:hypothetical protein
MAMMAASSIATPQPVKQKFEATNQASHVSNFTDSSAWQYGPEATPLCILHGGTERLEIDDSSASSDRKSLCVIHKAAV